MTVKMAKRDQIPAVHDTFVHILLTKPCIFFISSSFFPSSSTRFNLSCVAPSFFLKLSLQNSL